VGPGVPPHSQKQTFDRPAPASVAQRKGDRSQSGGPQAPTSVLKNRYPTLLLGRQIADAKLRTDHNTRTGRDKPDKNEKKNALIVVFIIVYIAEDLLRAVGWL
jgi:hypothetical protein